MKIGELRKQGFKAIAGDTLTNGLSDSIKLSIGGAVAVNNGYHDDLEIVDLLWRDKTSEDLGFHGNAEYSLDGWKPYLGKVYVEDKSANSNDETPVFTQEMADADELPPIGSLYLDDSSQVCKCIGYVFEKESVVGEMVEHVPIDGNVPLSICAVELTKVFDTRTEKQKAIDAAIAEWPVADKATLELAYDLWANKIEQ